MKLEVLLFSFLVLAFTLGRVAFVRSFIHTPSPFLQGVHFRLAFYYFIAVI